MKFASPNRISESATVQRDFLARGNNLTVFYNFRCPCTKHSTGKEAGNKMEPFETLEEPDDEMNQEVPVGHYRGGDFSLRNGPPMAIASSSRNDNRELNSGPSSSVADPDHNWQANKATVRERNAIMFNSDLMADVHFVVGSAPHAQRIPAHKYVLATGSSVFYAMFYGGLADGKNDIEIPDIEPTAFLNLLRYILI